MKKGTRKYTCSVKAILKRQYIKHEATGTQYKTIPFQFINRQRNTKKHTFSCQLRRIIGTNICNSRRITNLEQSCFVGKIRRNRFAILPLLGKGNQFLLHMKFTPSYCFLLIPIRYNFLLPPLLHDFEHFLPVLLCYFMITLLKRFLLPPLVYCYIILLVPIN